MLASDTFQVYPYLVELAMVILYPVLLGVVLGNARGASTVAADYNFIANAALAGVLIISMITCYPAGFQHVQEQVWGFICLHFLMHTVRKNIEDRIIKFLK